jgi:hypothetical protein
MNRMPQQVMMKVMKVKEMKEVKEMTRSRHVSLVEWSHQLLLTPVQVAAQVDKLEL